MKGSTEDDAEGECPFCHRKMIVNWSRNLLSHALPMCEAFKTMTADEFVQAVLDGKHKA